MAEETERLIEFARDAERALPDDLDWLIWTWQAVLQADPDCHEAQTKLHRLRRDKADRDVTARLDALLAQAQRASATNQVTDLTTLLNQLRVWCAWGEADPPSLSFPLYERVIELEGQVNTLYQETVNRLARVSDLLVAHDYREAYRQARVALERGVLRLLDRASQTEVDTVALCEETRDRFLTTLRRLAVQRVAEAETVGQSDPEHALHLLQDARAHLGDDVLSIDDRLGLRSQRDLVERAIIQMQRRLEQYKTAKTRVIQAHGRHGVEALTLLRIAREEFPTYPGLDSYIQTIEEQLAEIVAAHIATAITEARRRLGRQDYDAVFKIIDTARRQAVEQGIPLQTFVSLTSALDKLTQLEDEAVQAEIEARGQPPTP